MRAGLAALLPLIVLGCDDGGPAGTHAVFDLGPEAGPASFYSLPYPSDLRTGADGRAALDGVPIAAGNRLMDDIVTLARARHGAAVNTTAAFLFSGPLQPVDAAEVLPRSADALALLIRLDEPALLPAVAATLPVDEYVPEGLLIVAPVPGVILAPGTRYAVVVTRTLRDADGAAVRPAPVFEQLITGAGPDDHDGAAVRDHYQPLWPALDALGVPRDQVAVATIFTTADAVAETAALADLVVARHDAAIEGLQVDPDDGASHPRFCELHGEVTLPQFQVGEPPFNRDGLFAFDDDGAPILQRSERVPLTINVPRVAMPPGGFPVVLYLHGSGGLSTQVVDRGRITEPGGEPTVGEGPAHVLAAHGFATVSAALPLNPERLPGASSLAYLNFQNLTAYRDTFRQGALEQRLLIEALGALVIPADVVAACGGALPAGDVRLVSDRLAVLGQSMGAQYATMLGAIEPRVGAVVPTGSGGYFGLQVTTLELSDAIATLVRAERPLVHLHPALQLMQSAWEPAEPMVYMPRIAVRPLPGHAPRSLYQPIGKQDTRFPEPVFDASTLAYGNRQAGDPVWASLQDVLALAGLDGIEPYPVVDNLRSAEGAPYTGAAVQYAGDGIHDPHAIFTQRDEVKYQYGCFLASWWHTGTAVIEAPRSLDEGCVSLP